jgi:SAM-dependent methyltransferase
LAGVTPTRKQAVDVGCGSGQFTAQLAAHFADVIGVDPSADQIANAPVQKGVHYLRAPAERLPLVDGSTNLVTAAQAAHWFDLPAFYAEARRIAANGALIALISYGVLQFQGSLQERFGRFYHLEIRPYWPPERRLVDTGYRDIDFPFEERGVPEMSMEWHWSLGDFLGYLQTWSAVRRLCDAGHEVILTDFMRDIAGLWGDAAKKRPVSWPINMRVGEL